MTTTNDATQQFTNFPAWMLQDNTEGLRQFQGQIPGLFDTSGIQNASRTAQDSMLAQGRRAAGVAGTAYANRALQVGASGMGAGFATGQAMLGVYDKRNQMMANLASQMLASKQAQAQLTGSTIADAGRLAAQRQSTMADYGLGQQRIGLENNAQGLQAARDAEAKNEFGQSFALDTRRVDMQGDQFNKTYGLDAQRLAAQKAQFAQQLALDQQRVSNQNSQFGQSLGMQGQELAQRGSQFNASQAQQNRQFNADLQYKQQYSPYGVSPQNAAARQSNVVSWMPKGYVGFGF